MSLLPDLTEPPPTPYDLGQSPAEVVVISALPTDLAVLSEALAALPDALSLRLVHLMHLRHPASVDQHLDSCATHARLVILRLPEAGESWSYGLAQYTARCAVAGVPVAFLPIESHPEPELQQRSTVSDKDAQTLHSYLDEGGPENAQSFLRYCRAMLNHSERPAPPLRLPRTGLYWPGQGICDGQTVQQNWQPDRPIAAVLFPRALIHGAGLHPVNRMIRALLRAGLNPLPIFTNGADVDDLLSIAPPSVILSCLPGTTAPDLPSGVPVLHAALATCTEADWIESPNGLPPRDIAEHVLLPARDGQIITRAISTTDEALFDDATECPILAPRALGDRLDFTAQLAANWATLKETPRADRKIALVADGPEQALPYLRDLQRAGYSVADIPDSSSPRPELHLSLETYQQAFAALPWPLRDAMERRWGSTIDDPAFSADTGFRLPIGQCGNVVLAQLIDTPANTPPPHRLLALHVWLRQDFGAQALVHLGDHGGLGTLPGKALALSAECFPEQVLGPVPHIALFAASDTPDAILARNRLHALCLPLESARLIDALDGKPTFARNATTLPSAEAWRTGQAEADAWIEEYLHNHGDWPREATITFRAAPTALSDGANIARALGLMGLEPGEPDLPLKLKAAQVLTRPRVTLIPRFAPCFRRSYPELVTLIESACAIP